MHGSSPIVDRLTEKERLDLAKALVLVDAAIQVDPRQDPSVDPAVHQRARTSVANAMFALGAQSERNDPDVHYQLSTVYLGRMDAAWLYPQNILQWTDSMQVAVGLD